MLSRHTATIGMRATSLCSVSVLVSRASPVALDLARVATRTNTTWSQSQAQTPFQPQIQTQTQTPMPSSSRISTHIPLPLPAPWQLSDLKKQELQLYEKFAPSYPNNLKPDERQQIEEIVGRLQTLGQRLEAERGPNWYAVTKRASEIRKAKRGTKPSEGIAAIKEWWVRQKAQSEKDLAQRKHKLEKVARERTESGEVTKKMAFREMEVHLERIKAETSAKMESERRQKERNFYDTTKDKALAQALAEFGVQVDTAQEV